MKIMNRYVPIGADPFNMFQYQTIDVVMKHHVTQKTTVNMQGVEVPAHWSQNAKNVLVSKYFRRNGLPSITKTVDEAGVPEFLRRCEAMSAEDPMTTGEVSVKQVIHRIVGHITYVGLKSGYFDEDTGGVLAEVLRNTNARTYYCEMVYMMLNQMAAPNSPQWFNTGLWWAYGITGSPQGHSFVDRSHNLRGVASSVNFVLSNGTYEQAVAAMDIFTVESPNAYEHTQAHACFILDLKDTLLGEHGISDWMDRETRIFKFGSGSGVNVSNLRGRSEKLSGGGTSSGAMSFVEVADRNAGAIKSGGTTRRAAKMVVMNIDHPDIEEFIDCKLHAENTVASLVIGSNVLIPQCNALMKAVIDAKLESSNDTSLVDLAILNPTVLVAMKNARAAGVMDNYIVKAISLAVQGWSEWPSDVFTTDFDGGAYQVAPFQNANNSVRITSDFYQAVDRNEGWDLVNRKDGKINTTVLARHLEHKFAAAAWFSGDPGIHFHTTFNDWNVTPEDGEIVATNPCSEHARLNGSACNLASLNLIKFMNDGKFNVESYQHAVHLWQIALDITNTMAHLPDRFTAKNVYLFRDTGLGYANLGAVIMAHGLSYDSDAGRALIGAVTAIHHGQANLTSSKMAQHLGAYPRYAVNAEHHMRCMRNHRVALGSESGLDPDGQYQGLTVKPPMIQWNEMAIAGLSDTYVQSLFSAAKELWDEVIIQGSQFGFRNAEATVIAPTGTISIIMDCDTTGVEPMLGLTVYKQLVGGGMMCMVPSYLGTALERLGYSDEERKVMLDFLVAPNDPANPKSPANGYIPEEMFKTIEHANVFLTSFPNPKTGKCLPWQSHVKAMAACQPFVSGAISKTINMPSDATIEDVKQAYRLSHDLGVKAVAIYRDGSKLSQPLNIAKLSEAKPAQVEDFDPSDIIQGLQQQVDSLRTELELVLKKSDVAESQASTDKGLSLAAPLAARKRLSWWRQPGIDICVDLSVGKLYLRTTRYDDGRLAEIWANWSADQGMIQAMIGVACKTANVALQHGVPLDAIIGTWLHSTFEPSGTVWGHPYIKTCKSIVNLIARLLDFHELGNTAHLNIQPVEQDAGSPAPGTAMMVTVAHTKEQEKTKIVYSGNTCPTCASARYVSSGAGCSRCLDCGYAGGCG